MRIGPAAGRMAQKLNIRISHLIWPAHTGVCSIYPQYITLRCYKGEEACFDRLNSFMSHFADSRIRQRYPSNGILTPFRRR